jgi:hypothetical protein
MVKPNDIDLTAATIELPPDDPVMEASRLAEAVALVDTAQKARIAQLTEDVARRDVELALLKDPLAEDFQVPKRAAFITGIPRPTLERWAAKGWIKSKKDPRTGHLLICVIDARRQRYHIASQE